MNNTLNVNKYLKLYIFILFGFSIFTYRENTMLVMTRQFLNGLINYEGGFTKRGLVGQIAISISELFNYSLRQSILFFKLFLLVYIIYY